MTHLTVGSTPALRGTIRVPGDKSISHRSVLLGALADGTSHIRGFLEGADCQATLKVMTALGVRIEFDGPQAIRIHGVGLQGLQEPHQVLDCQNSGTTMRLVAGILAGQKFQSILTGTRQLCSRPMGRILTPLQAMGAHVHGRSRDQYAPLALVPAARGLQGVAYALPVASAQVKSCLLLAGLFAAGETAVTEPGPTRDHTERMLQAMGLELQKERMTPAPKPRGAYARICLQAPDNLRPLDMQVPGDPSSAAFLLVAGALVPDSRLRLSNVGCNETRTGLMEALIAMGASITQRNPRMEAGERVAELEVAQVPLQAADFGGDDIVRMIDELPLLALACTQAEGTSTIRDAQELRYKESDRIDDTVRQLSRLGADIEGRPDGFVIHGPTPLQAAAVHSRGDHRLAMMLTVAGLLTGKDTVVHESQVTADSFPGFVDVLQSLGASIEEVDSLD